MPEFQTAYSPKVRPITVIKEPSLTEQSKANDANINHIIKRHMKTGTLADLNKLEAVYGEITQQSLIDAHNQVQAAHEAFEQIPSHVRKQFDNDPGKFIDYATREENLEQMRLWGLAKPIEQGSQENPGVNVDGTVDLDGDVTTSDTTQKADA